MMRRPLEDEENLKKMKEDNFELSRKQTDPDYEAIHFNRGNATNSVFKKDLDKNISTVVSANAFDEIETASVLDFSSKKRELVLGIDRKPEIRPLAAFKIGHSLESSSDDGDSIANDIIEVDINEDAELTEEDESEFGESETPTTENISFKNNPFLKSQPNTFRNQKPVNHAVNKVVKPPRNKNSSQAENNKMKGNMAAALIKQFNNNGLADNNIEEKTSKTVKTTTKQLINKFNNNSKSDHIKTTTKSSPNSHYPHPQRFSYNIPQSKPKPGKQEKSSNVLKIVSALNKSGFPQSNTDLLSNE